MGLDSVELVITIEKHFAISISDGEAEKAMTVQDVADLVARHRPLVPDDRDVRGEVRIRLLRILEAQTASIADDTPFAELCQERLPAEIWRQWPSNDLLKPDLPPNDQRYLGSNSWFAFMIPKWAPDRSILDLTFGQVLDAVVAHNHMRLIDPLRPRSRYEILMAVIGVSSDSIGVAELEMRPTDSYVNDLGVS